MRTFTAILPALTIAAVSASPAPLNSRYSAITKCDCVPCDAYCEEKTSMLSCLQSYVSSPHYNLD
jgi:hypothetical protein